jgi:hypothetical protein
VPAQNFQWPHFPRAPGGNPGGKKRHYQGKARGKGEVFQVDCYGNVLEVKVRVKNPDALFKGEEKNSAEKIAHAVYTGFHKGNNLINGNGDRETRGHAEKGSYATGDEAKQNKGSGYFGARHSKAFEDGDFFALFDLYHHKR